MDNQKFAKIANGAAVGAISGSIAFGVVGLCILSTPLLAVCGVLFLVFLPLMALGESGPAPNSPEKEIAVDSIVTVSADLPQRRVWHPQITEKSTALDSGERPVWRVVDDQQKTRISSTEIVKRKKTHQVASGRSTRYN